MFRIGQRVICVKIYGDDARFGLRVNDVYTISQMGMGSDGAVCDVAEIKTMCPGAWRVDCFRPAVERETDISIFTHMLTSQGVDA